MRKVFQHWRSFLSIPLTEPRCVCRAVRQAIARECLDKFIVFGKDHLDHVCNEYREHYHLERPHQGMGNKTLVAAVDLAVEQGEVCSRERLGGALRHYYRAVA